MKMFSDFSPIEKASLIVEILTRSALFVALVLPFMAYFIFIHPDWVLGLFSLFLAVVIGFPFGFLGSWVWKWQLLVLIMCLVILGILVEFYDPLIELVSK